MATLARPSRGWTRKAGGGKHGGLSCSVTLEKREPTKFWEGHFWWGKSHQKKGNGGATEQLRCCRDSKLNHQGLRRCWSMLPRTRVPFWYQVFEPQACVCVCVCVCVTHQGLRNGHSFNSAGLSQPGRLAPCVFLAPRESP